MSQTLLPIALRVESGTLLLRCGSVDDGLTSTVLRAVVEHVDGRRTADEVWTDSAPDGATTRTDDLTVSLNWMACDDGLRIDTIVTNCGDAEITLQQLELEISGFGAWWASLDVTARALRLAFCGAHSRSQTSRSYVTCIDASAILESWWIGALSGPRGPGVVIGGMQPERFVTRVRTTRDALVAEFPLEGWALAPGERVQIDPLWLGATSAAPLAAMERFATVLGTAMHARVNTPPTGWGSWGHWFERIDAGLMREMVHAIDGSPALRHVVDVVQIDDGWSELLDSRRVSASWRPNTRFPSGLAPLAAEVARTGRRCGLWLLPFAVNAGSSIVDSHPQWLVRNSAGEPHHVGDSDSYCLDPTHPAAAAWLTALLQGFRDWGFDYIKLDFLRALLAPDPAIPADSFRVPRRHHAARTRLEAYREGLRVIRAAVGDDVTIVSCSAPAAAGVGLVDCHRVGPDIDKAWTGRLAGVQDAARAVATNWFWQGRAWVNDPDYLLVCESQSLTRFWATVVALSGGSMILSADLSTLEPWAEQMLSLVMPPVGLAARPIDLFAHAPEPRHWVLPLQRGMSSWTMLGLLNWGERPVTERLAPAYVGVHGPTHIWDVWRQRHSIAETVITVPVEAQSASLLRLTPVTREPTLVGTDIHWAQGWHEIESVSFDPLTGTLRIVPSASMPRRGKAWIWVPHEWALADRTDLCVNQLAVVTLGGSDAVVIHFTRSPHSQYSEEQAC